MPKKNMGMNFTEVKLYKIMIVGRDRLMREGLHQLVRRSPAILVADGRNASEAIGMLASDVTPDLALLNLQLQHEADDELSQLRELQLRFPETKLVILGDVVRSSIVKQAVRAGAHAVLSREISGDMLQKSLQFVMLGQLLLPASIVLSMMEDVANGTHADRPGSGEHPDVITATLPPSGLLLPNNPPAPRQHRTGPLSDREREILQCLIDGLSNKAVARKLDIAEATVKVHVKSLLRKIQVTNRTQAAVWGLSQGAAMELPSPAALVQDHGND
ncbi:LuxR C-terminal-related transcriptional regulator [Roseomonas elaeocarpi]|uniref:LuxR C-terminal-related transcriptional regulator n=1 Tax=Roseomonas elaeocarpi TaxID=907779 RepID=A0ABV6JPV4_9PROT